MRRRARLMARSISLRPAPFDQDGKILNAIIWGVSMEQMSDEEIERHLIEGTNEAEMREILGDATYDALRAESADIGNYGVDPTQELLGFGRGDKPDVYILPGIMGSKLSAQKESTNDLIWFDPIDIRRGGVSRLKFGSEPDPILATGVFWSTYGALRLRLQTRGYKVRYLPYDWRRSVPDIGADLLAQIGTPGENGIVLAAHSMGGLVARQMAALDTNGVIKRVVTMGTPNYGSYSPVQVFRIASEMLNKIGWLDDEHTPSQIAKLYLRHFPGLVEMMPDPVKRPAETYFDPTYWPSGGARPNNRTLADALTAKMELPAPDDRFHQIIGYGQETVVSATRSDSELSYNLSNLGDGTVPVDLAQVEGVPQYFVEATHSGMVQRRDVARAVHHLIKDATTDAISGQAPTPDLTTETRTQAISDEALRQVNRQITRPEEPDVQDILSEFLSVPEPNAQTDALHESTSEGSEETDLSLKIGGYPLSVLMQASRAWRGEDTGVAPEEVVLHLRETEQRIKKYAARKLQQLRTVVEEAPRQHILPDSLREIVATAEENPNQALNALLNERVMGEAEEFLSVLYLKRAPIVSKSVGRIIRRNTEIGFGTGFMVAPGVLITNHHVLRDAQAAQNAAVQFDYEINYRNREMQSERFELRPDQLFYADRTLDFALVAVEAVSSESGRALADYGYLPLDGGEGKIKIGKPINVIQHPNAERKQAVFRNAALQDLPANTLAANAQFSGAPADIAAHYSADTKPGSSGSPVFSDAWEVIALHHSAVAVIKDGKFRMKDQSFVHPNLITNDHDVDWLANEGIRISRITKHLERVVNDQETQTAQTLIQSVLDAGYHANRYGHFSRALPDPVLTQFDQVGASPRDGAPENVMPRHPGAGPQDPRSVEFEGLLSTLRDALARLGAGGSGDAPGGAGGQTSAGGRITVNSDGVAIGSGGLEITYRGDASSPYGRSATASRRAFDSIVLHHNAANLTTDWLIRYQIDGDSTRGGHFGYHFYIDPTGAIFQGAPMGKRTNHVKSPSRSQRKTFGRIASNNSSIGVTCVKAGPAYSPTAAQIAAQDQLVAALAGAYGIAFTNVFGHGEIQSDRSAHEGASQAQKIRGWGATAPNLPIGPEALSFSDDMDDSALETYMSTPVESLVGDGREMMPHAVLHEDDDDESFGVLMEGASLGRFGTAPVFGAEAAGTRLSYTNGGAIRNRPCTANLEARLIEAVEAVYGTGYTINIYSGGQDRRGFGTRRTGSIRHDDYGQGGRAADVYVFDPSGAKVQGVDLARLGQYWLAANFGCVGHEMGGGGIHLDEWVPPPTGGGRFWTYAASNAQPWGPDARALLVRGAGGSYP